MFERFTDRARKSMQLANQEAAKLGHSHVESGHILIGLLREGNGVAAHVLKRHGILLKEQLLDQLVKLMPPSEESQGILGKLPLSDEGKAAVDRSIEEAKSLNHNYVGTEHILLGLIGDPASTAAKVLAGCRVTAESVRQGVLDVLGFGKEETSDEPDARSMALNVFCVLGRKLAHTDTEKALYEASMGVLLGVLKPATNGGQ